jgi:hypothetical protein
VIDLLAAGSARGRIGLNLAAAGAVSEATVPNVTDVGHPGENVGL